MTSVFLSIFEVEIQKPIFAYSNYYLSFSVYNSMYQIRLKCSNYTRRKVSVVSLIIELPTAPRAAIKSVPIPPYHQEFRMYRTTRPIYGATFCTYTLRRARWQGRNKTNVILQYRHYARDIYGPKFNCYVRNFSAADVYLNYI